MATNTYVALRTETITTATPSVTFNLSGITGYTDLVVVISARSSRTSLDWIKAQVNSDTTTSYSYTQIQGNGTAATSGRESTINSYGFLGNIPGTDSASGTFGVSTVHFMNYSNPSVFKTVLARGNSNNSTGGTTDGIVGLWRNTAAITSILFYSGTGNNFAVDSTFTIYGIAAASAAAKATGGTIYQDSTHFYHVFAGNGTFTPTQSISADVLTVAGGGGGGSGNVGSGGGAGGLLYLASQSLTATGYSITVGAGGAGRVGDGNATNGVNSQFGALTAAVGGGAGTSGASFVNGVAGGSGGGAWTFGGIGGAGTSGQGNAGGNGSGSASPYPSGGGGGAGAPGTAATSTASGAGGAGSSTFTSWGTVTGMGQNVSGIYYLAGGGGGGASAQGATLGVGGIGGGGTGGGAGVGANGVANTGGGAGGGGNSASYSGGTGGSGLVIVRYLKA
jgi:hypothetical protein